jgi:hypothetical protein
MSTLLYGEGRGRATPAATGGAALPGHELHRTPPTALPQSGDFRDVAVVFFYVLIDVLRCCKMFFLCFNNDFVILHL